MSLFNKFSVTYNLDRVNKKKSKSQIKEASSFSNLNKNVLTKEVAEALLQLDYELESIVQLFKVHPYSNVDEALTLLSKDQDTKKYNHKLVLPQKNQKEMNIVPNERCLICKGIKSDHLDNSFFIEENKQESIDKGKEKINKISTTENNMTSQPLFNEQSLFSSVDLRHNYPSVEYTKVVIPEDTLKLFELPDICRICFGEQVNPNNPAQIPCSHFFCDTCIQVYLTTKIINGRVLDIKCLYGGCPKKYTNEEIKRNVSAEVYNKYKKFFNEQIKLNNPNKLFVNCPSPDCEEIVDCDNYIDEFAECDNHHVFCYKCHYLGRHKRDKCQNEDIILFKQIKKGNSNSVNYKQCPKCKVIIEKNEGCNQMKCINCQHNFCWLCMKKYTDDHYAIYNVRGCPGMRFEQNTQSKWRSNPCLKFLRYLLSCFLGFWILILILLFYLLLGCSYEFVKCYMKKKSSEDEDDSIDYEYDIERSNYNSSQQGNNNNGEQEEEKKQWGKIIFIGFLGFLCQPLYLTFYLLYGLMECYRRFNCWFYYVDY